MTSSNSAAGAPEEVVIFSRFWKEGSQGRFSPDGRFLATASQDHTVVIWNVGELAERQHIALWPNDQQPVNNITFRFGPDRQLGLHVSWSNENVYFDVAGCCGANQRINTLIPDRSLYSGQWNHDAFVKAEGYTAICLNGSLFHDSGADVKDPLLDITAAGIGADETGANSHGGLMDDIGVWDEALGEDAIRQIMGEIPPTYVGGRGTIGAKTFDSNRSNEVFGPEQSGVPGWTGRIVTGGDTSRGSIGFNPNSNDG
jgi:hypothetical protein